MGVHGLWRLLESTGKPINPETLEGKILAVDISIWLNQAVKGVRDRDGYSVQNAHLLTLFNRICKLLFFRIKPVFVFDGDAPLLKKETLALRRQRNEELTRESKQTNEKLLKTFLKRQAIKAALGNSSKEPLPSLSTVRRNEVDDIYVLPALPSIEEKEKSSSGEEEEHEEMVDRFHSYEEEICDDPNSVDINSEEFSSLPSEMKHEILKEMKELSKRRRTMYQKPPERSSDFSQYQLAGLLHRNRLNQRLEGVEKEMSQRSAGSAPQLCQQDGDQHSHNVESNRLVSEDHSHYILIKGSKKSDIAPKSQPAVAPWSGSFPSSSSRKAAGKPEPLWQLVEEEETAQTTIDESKASVSTPSEGDTNPPSPQTLRAIQAALNESSDEENLDQDGKVSPRTLLAIQQALVVEEDGVSSSACKLQDGHLRTQPQVIADSVEETQHSPKERLNIKSNKPDQSSQINDRLFGSSSEDEMEEMISRRNKALQFAALQQNPGANVESETTLMRETTTEGQPEDKEPKEPEDKSYVSVSNKDTLPINLFRTPCGNSDITTTVVHSSSMEKDEPAKAPKDTNGDDVKSHSSKDSDSEDSFVEVSEEEVEEKDEDDSIEITEEKSPLEDVCKVEEKKELEEDLTTSPSQLVTAENLKEENENQSGNNEVKEETKTKSSPAVNDWEHFDMDELEALESSLQVEQSNLKEQKKQQERMANTVTGQMCLESQELLRLFGVPYLVAPMEAEAQCAALDRADQTHGTITDDSDVWLFGGRHVYKNFFSHNKYVEHYEYNDLQNQLGLDRTKLINLAYLLGSDYTEGVPGVGYVTGMELLNEFPGPGMEPLIELSKWWSEAQEKKRLVADPLDTKVKKKLRDIKLQPGFPNPAVAEAYWHPAVDQSDSLFSWGRPQLDMIKEFCLSRFGWSSGKTAETLRPVIKQLNNQQTQLRIDSFFHMEQHDKLSIRSQRLRRAVTCLKRKQREGGGDENSEEEIPSPYKSKKKSLKNREEQEEEERTTAAGGFLGSVGIDESPLGSLEDVCSLVPTKAAAKTLPQKTKQSSSSSSGEDSDYDKGVPMVKARSVFGDKRGRGAKTTRGRGRGKSCKNIKLNK